MTGAFDPEAFDSEAFDTGDEVVIPPSGGRAPMRLTLDLTPKDDEETALLVALLRHRFRI